MAGHYALKGWSSDCRPTLLRPVDRLKDQTYFLSAISEAALRRALFPIGHLRKSEVRDLAKQHGLTTAERPDSVGICFVGEKARFNRFLCMWCFLVHFKYLMVLFSILHSAQIWANHRQTYRKKNWRALGTLEFHHWSERSHIWHAWETFRCV